MSLAALLQVALLRASIPCAHHAPSRVYLFIADLEPKGLRPDGYNAHRGRGTVDHIVECQRDAGGWPAKRGSQGNEVKAIARHVEVGTEAA